MTTTEERAHALETFVRPLLLEKTGRYKGRTPDKVALYIYTDQQGGVRVSELSYLFYVDPNEPSAGCAGGSWMRSDPECGNVILACEEYLLTYDEPLQSFDSESYYDPRQESEQHLAFAITGEFPEWEDRREAT